MHAYAWNCRHLCIAMQSYLRPTDKEGGPPENLNGWQSLMGVFLRESIAVPSTADATQTIDNDCFKLYRSIVYYDGGLSSNSSSPSEPVSAGAFVPRRPESISPFATNLADRLADRLDLLWSSLIIWLHVFSFDVRALSLAASLGLWEALKPWTRSRELCQQKECSSVGTVCFCCSWWRAIYNLTIIYIYIHSII